MVCSLAVGTEKFRSCSVFTRDSGEGSAAGGELVATPNEGFFSLETMHHHFGREGRIICQSVDSGLDVGVMIVEGVDEQYRSELILVDGSHVHDLSVQIVDLDDGVAYGSVGVETDIEGFFQEKNLGMEPEMLMAAAKFLEDGVRSGDGLDEFEFIFGDASMKARRERSLLLQTRLALV
jgi:hypothetical protein